MRRLIVSIAASVFMAGCQGQPQRFEFHSTESLPKTVRVADAYTDRTIWQRDVPVGQTLFVQLDRTRFMAWRIEDESGEIDLSDLTPELKVHYRRHTQDAVTEPAQSSHQRQPVPSKDPDFVITVTPDGRYLIDKEAYAFEDLKQSLNDIAATSPGDHVLIRAMDDTPAKFVLRLVGICEELKLKVTVSNTKNAVPP